MSDIVDPADLPDPDDQGMTTDGHTVTRWYRFGKLVECVIEPLERTHVVAWVDTITWEEE